MFTNIKQCPDEMKDRLVHKMIKNAKERLFEDDMECIICSCPTENIEAFEPNGEATLFGTPGQGQFRLIMYTICPYHDTTKPWTQQALEKALINQRQ